MAVPSKFSINCQIKSISLPCRSHPSTFQIEEQLNKIKSAAPKPSAETICSSLFQLTEVYKCMDDLVTSSNTQVLISRKQNKKWVDELIEESVAFLDICGSTRDMVSQIKEHSRNLHCDLRRRKGNMNNKSSIEKYNCFRKKMKKDARGMLACLKQVDNMTGDRSVVVDSDHRYQLAAVIKAVVGVSEMTISVFESLLTFFSVLVSKPNRWSLGFSRLIHKGMVACEDQEEEGFVNELESLDVALRNLWRYRSSGEGHYVQIAQCRLERLEAQIESLEISLESMFRSLVQTRSSLLNIISQ